LEHSKLQIAPLIASIQTDEEFESLASEIFLHQVERNNPFKKYITLIKQNKAFSLNHPHFLPIELFKSLHITCESTHDLAFKSSGTTVEGERSSHFVHDKTLYEDLAMAHFEEKYGSLNDWVVLALLPSYLENGDSSLVFMVEHFIQHAKEGSGFMLHQPESLKSELERLRGLKQKTLLIGVSFALLDFVEHSTFSFEELIVMETGGMKGRRKELTRAELHAALRLGFPNAGIHSEYGMTELLSQAYSSDGKWFSPPRWMKAFTTEISDPFHVLHPGQRGLLAFIDLANYHSCSFIQTRDIGVVNDQGLFTVEGRLDKSDLRGCNLLYT
jgi:hypothetical protein